MQICKKACTQSLLASVFALTAVGCASHTAVVTPAATTGPSGRAALGAISGATVWADSIVSGTRFGIDTGTDPAESATQTTTNAQGSFTIPAQPVYKYVIAVQGGTDSITGRPATSLIAPGGSANVSPFTALAALEQTGQFAAKMGLNILAGRPLDFDVTASGALSPALGLQLTALSNVMTALDVAIAAKIPAGVTVTPVQLMAIKLTMLANLSAALGAPGVDLTNTASMATAIQAGIASGLTQIASTNSNITGLTPSAIASISQTVAINSVVSAAQVIGNASGNPALQAVNASNILTAGVSISVSGNLTESVIISGANLTNVNGAINNSSQAISGVITVAPTPGGYTPPTLPIAQNPTVSGYRLVATRGSGEAWNVTALTVTFSDDMATSGTGSVTTASNYVFSNGTCTPQAYAATTKTVSFTCTGVVSGNFNMTVLAATATVGVRNTATTPLGLIVSNVKTFVLPSATGSTGGSSVNLF